CSAQQEEMTAFLENALKAAEDGDEKELITNLTYFSTAIEDHDITPEKLTDENLDLYTNALFTATWKKLNIPENLAKKAILFLEYKIEEKPKNMFALGYLNYEGIGIPQNYIRAIYWYEKAAEKEND